MKIYFAGSIRGGRADADLYQSLIYHLKKCGEVFTEHIGNEGLTVSGENETDNAWIHERDMKWLLSSDVLIAEVSTPSLGVGYEIGRAIENKKPILCLYRSGSEKKLSAMISGSPEVSLCCYATLHEATGIIDDFLSNLSI